MPRPKKYSWRDSCGEKNGYRDPSDFRGASIKSPHKQRRTCNCITNQKEEEEERSREKKEKTSRDWIGSFIFRHFREKKEIMDSKCIFSSFLLFALLLLLSSSGAVVRAQDASMTECVKKLMPCQPYLHESPSASPPAMCCDPLKEMVKGDAGCLCAVFQNPAIMKSLNITEKDAMGLAKACGANADTSICKKGSISLCSKLIRLPIGPFSSPLIEKYL